MRIVPTSSFSREKSEFWEIMISYWQFSGRNFRTVFHAGRWTIFEDMSWVWSSRCTPDGSPMSTMHVGASQIPFLQNVVEVHPIQKTIFSYWNLRRKIGSEIMLKTPFENKIIGRHVQKMLGKHVFYRGSLVRSLRKIGVLRNPLHWKYKFS